MNKIVIAIVLSLLFGGAAVNAVQVKVKGMRFGAPMVYDHSTLTPSYLGLGDIVLDEADGLFYGYSNNAGSGTPGWRSFGGASSSVLNVVSRNSANANSISSDDVILADTSTGFTLSLFTAVGNKGKLLRIKKVSTDANALTVDPNSTETVDGLSTVVMVAPNDTLTIMSDDINWVVISREGAGLLFLKDIKSNNTAPQSITAGSYVTRDLNTKEGDVSLASLSSNQFTLQAGKYEIEATAPNRNSSTPVTLGKLKLRNVTDSADVIIGDAVGSGNPASDGDLHTILGSLRGTFSITAAKTFEIQQRVSVTGPQGIPANFSDSEVYTQVRIKKIH